MTEALWTSDEIAAATHGSVSAAFAARGVSIDSRTLSAGDLFVALDGPEMARDGHDFVKDALARGAAGALVARRPASVADDAPLIQVDHTLRALEAMGRHRRAAIKGKVTAVTGSVGKTSVKEGLRHILNRQGPTHASAASYNNLWGVPLSLARMPKATAYGVFEIGMNHAGEIRPLTRQARPDVAIVTTVEAVHLEYLGTIEAIADAKAEIFEGLEGGTAVINRDNRFHTRLSEAAFRCGAGTIMTFGADPASDLRLVSFTGDGVGSSLVIEGLGYKLQGRLGQPGRHVAQNALAMLCAAHALGADVPAAFGALGDLGAVDGRGVRQAIAWRGGQITLIDESYNASPVSVRAALAVLRDVPTAGRRIAVLGDMRELGRQADAMHRDLADDVRTHADLLFACGEHMRVLFEAVPASQRGGYATDAKALAPILRDAVAAGDAVMIKGSRGSAMEHVVKALQQSAGV